MARNCLRQPVNHVRVHCFDGIQFRAVWLVLFHSVKRQIDLCTHITLNEVMLEDHRRNLSSSITESWGDSISDYICHAANS